MPCHLVVMVELFYVCVCVCVPMLSSWHLALYCLCHTPIVHLILILILVHVVPSSHHHPRHPCTITSTKLDQGVCELKRPWIKMPWIHLKNLSDMLGFWRNIYQVKVPSRDVTMQYLWDVWLATMVELCTFQQLQLQVAKKSCNVKYSRMRKFEWCNVLPIKSNDKLLHPFHYLLNVITRIDKEIWMNLWSDLIILGQQI